MSDPILELRDISYQYPGSGWSLHLSGFSIQDREVVGIIGPNGSGKSTLLRLAAGVLIPDAGSIRLGGNDLIRMERKSIARHLGYLPQELGSVYDFRVEEIVRMGRYPYLKGVGSLGASDVKAVERSLVRTDLQELKRRRLSRLSGGEKQRAFLASVLSQEPDVLLLDEPTAALDVHRQVRFFRLLRELASSGIGVGVVTHDLNLASLFSDRLILLSGGECIKSGRPVDVLNTKVMKQVYGRGLLVKKHPDIDRPTVLPGMPFAEE